MSNDQEDPHNLKQENLKKTTTTEHCIKIWSERTKRWRYIPKDPAYFRIKYYEYLGPKTCSVCGAVVQTQMCRHQRSQRCQLIKQSLSIAAEHLETAIKSRPKDILEDNI
jgi:hypothetical protein